MSASIKASVIIPVKNPGPLFRRALSAVLAQQTDFPFEVLVIDSGSGDGTLEYLASEADERLRLHQIEAAAFGHGRTRNLGVSLTSGEYAVLITHDAMPVDQFWLGKLVALADSDPEIAGVFGRHVAYPDADPYTKRELEQHFAGFDAFRIVSLDDPARYEREQGYRQVLHFFSNNNALIRRSVWQKFPYPEVDFAEDQIWAKHIIEAGYKKAYARDAAVFHSHSYSLIERLRRSFDESYAFHRLFGYVLCDNLVSLAASWAAMNSRDLAYAVSSGLLFRRPLLVSCVPCDNLMRLVGHYLGARGDSVPDGLLRFFSHDRRLLLGIRAGNKNTWMI